MSKRLKIMLAVMLAVGLLMLFDRPPEIEVVGVSERPRERAAAAPPAMPVRAAATIANPADPVPDLFAGAPGDAAPSATAQGADGGRGEGGEAGEKPAPPFVLMGFKEEDGVREAYLLRHDGVLLARAGAVLEKRYRVLALRQESVDIQDQQTGKQHRIGFGTEE